MIEIARNDGRDFDQLRPVKITTGFVDYPEGSVLIEMGNTRVLCNATVEEGVPRWMAHNNTPGGWITAEYAMLPRSTQQRVSRDNVNSSRSQEIRRLVGRSLRASINLPLLGPYTVTVDCDVLQADGGTRTAAITGGYVALSIAINGLVKAGKSADGVFLEPVAAISAGILNNRVILDLNYAEDSHAQTDANVVMNAAGKFIELQSTAESTPFSRAQLDQILSVAEKGITELLREQKAAITNALQTERGA